MSLAAIPRPGEVVYVPELQAFRFHDGTVADRLLGRPSKDYTLGALESAARGDLKPALAEHHRDLVLNRTLEAGPGHVATLRRVRIDGQEVEVGYTAGRDPRPWWRRLFG